jgi:hypothetical protein
MRGSGSKRAVRLVISTIAFVALTFAEESKVATGDKTATVDEKAVSYVTLAPEDSSTATESPDPQTAAASPKAKDSKPTAAASPDPEKLHVGLYPLFGWIPFFSSNFTVPPLPGGGGGGDSIGGGSNVKITGGVAFAVDATYKKLLVEGEATFVNVTGTRPTPNASVSTHLKYGDLFVGWEVWKGLYALTGFRRTALDFSVTVLNAPTFSRSPGLWDPLLGAEYRKQLKHKINVQARFDAGGFGVGSDVDIDAQGRVEWRFSKHFGTLIGYQILYEKLTGTVTQPVANTTITYPWKYAQTFHGPVLGIGIYF